MITHILFDFFGTLVQYAEKPIADGYARTFALMKGAGYSERYDEFVIEWQRTYVELDEVAKKTHREFSMSELMERIVRRSLLEHVPELERKLLVTYIREWNASVRYVPEVQEMVKRLSSRYALAVVTNTHDEALVPYHLESMGVADHIEVVVTSVGYGIRKPNARIFEHALDRLNASARSCIYVGDSYEADFVGGQGAGIRTLLIDPDEEALIPEEHRIDSVLSVESVLSH